MRSTIQMVVEGTLMDAELSLDMTAELVKAIERATANGYDLDEWDAVELFREQAGVCAICKKPFTATPIVEHRHESESLGRTHLVRGFVCSTCNAIAKNYDGVEAHCGHSLDEPWWAEYNQRTLQRKQLSTDRKERFKWSEDHVLDLKLEGKTLTEIELIERGYSGNGQTASDVLERALAKLDFQKCGDERGSRWSEAVTQYEDGLKEEVKRRRSLEK